jgi:DNA mismatch repair protein MutS2
MNTHALAVLEFSRVLELVATRASTATGAARIRSLLPGSDVSALETEQARTAAVRTLIEAESGWIPHPLPELEHVLSRLRLAGATLTGPDLVALGTTLRSARLTRDALAADEPPLAARAILAPLRERLLSDLPSEQAIERVVAEDGTVKDGASPLLRRLRRDLRGAEGELVALLERAMHQLDARYRVADMSVTVRNGRYVIPIRREGRGALGGLVHDTSASGATLFVEPPAAIEACNQIRELEAEEAQEVDRLLAELSERLRPLHPALDRAADALAELDSLYARARFAIDYRCGLVHLQEPGRGFDIRGARHPLLVEQGIDVVPFDLQMSTDERTLLVSGPNTGGKTVLLKTLGLLSAMIQAGIPVPADAGSSVVVYGDIFADVGDEQSIQASLSTFSAHLTNIAEILRSATNRSLVLLDELGSGTDPLEGAALGGAVLEALTARGALTVATSHLGALKELASEIQGIVNASLQFDAEALAPTYNLIKGIPGRSYGISIARRLRLPEDVVRRAEERVPKVERDVNALLVSLEARDAELGRREAEARESRDSAQEWAHRLAERESRLRERERRFERESRQETRRYLLEARAAVERTIKDLRRAAGGDADEAARAARQQVEQLAESQRAQLAHLEAEIEEQPDSAPGADQIEPGDVVQVRTLGGRAGRVIELRDDACVILIGDMKMTYARGDLARVSPERLTPEMPVPTRGELPEVHAPTEIDVRGLRALEVEEVVMQAVDAAIRADLPVLRIIHGKGTGALRQRVAEMLRKDTRVRSFRLGAWNEGGAGVTVAEL